MYFDKKRVLLVILLKINLLNTFGITYEFSYGRFGDNLLAYIHAKWLSYKYNIPLFYKPFPYSKELILNNEQYNFIGNKRKLVILSKDKLNNLNLRDEYIYSIPYFSEDAYDLKNNKSWMTFKRFCNVDWKDQIFINTLKQMIHPKTLKVADLSNIKYTKVAIHIRLGIGFDYPITESLDNILKGNPNNFLKFPPLDFYIEQLKELSSILGHKNMYVYLFMDIKDTFNVAKRVMSSIKDYKNIYIDFRKSNNDHNKNVLEDFFAITKFDYLIRPQSNFSFVAGRLANLKMEIFPSDYYKTKNGMAHISKIEYNYF